ncbi:MAG: hypothetical protein ABSB33_08800, partial [Tepidisphaeraceae bacterium]
MTGGKLFHPASSSANIGSIAALFAAPFPESLDFSVESAIVRSLSWAYQGPTLSESAFLFSRAPNSPQKILPNRLESSFDHVDYSLQLVIGRGRGSAFSKFSLIPPDNSTDAQIKASITHSPEGPCVRTSVAPFVPTPQPAAEFPWRGLKTG